MTDVIVRDWPSYLLKGIPDQTAAALMARAETDGVSVNDVIRAALCAHYGMDCPPQSAKHNRYYLGGDTVLIRMQPDLYARIKKDTAQQYGAVRRLILTTLDAYLEAP